MPTFLKILGSGLLVTLLGIFFVQRDIRLRIWGVTVDANLSGAWVGEGLLDNEKKIEKIEFTFRDAKSDLHQGSFVPRSGWKPASDMTVKVLYLASDPTIYRLASEGAFGAYVFFIAGLLLVALGVRMFFQESVVASHKSETLVNAKGKVGRIMDILTD